MAGQTKRKSKPTRTSPDASELLVLELQQIHHAEGQLSRVMPRLSKDVESDTLRELMNERLATGERIVQEIEDVFDEVEEKLGRKKNVAAEGLLNDARDIAQEIEPGPALDTVLIGALQKAEHYCIASWGTARALAQAIELESAAEAMQRALDDGKKFDENLTELAEQEITPALLSSSEPEEQEEEPDEAEENEKKGGGQASANNGERRKGGTGRRAAT